MTASLLNNRYKQLKPMVSRPEVFAIVRQRFDREAAVLESVGRSHSQIPDLYAYFEENGQLTQLS